MDNNVLADICKTERHREDNFKWMVERNRKRGKVALYGHVYTWPMPDDPRWLILQLGDTVYLYSINGYGGGEYAYNSYRMELSMQTHTADMFGIERTLEFCVNLCKFHVQHMLDHPYMQAYGNNRLATQVTWIGELNTDMVR